jgi:pimeloyl-ACP methyl ester carboxylesterase
MPEYKPLKANGVDFFCTARGKGPALLLIPDIGGDSGPYDLMADKLIDSFQVITYDLRGHSRSSSPGGWHKTTMAEQADDAAAILKELKIKEVNVFGSGVGALIGLELAMHYPNIVRKALLHDPLIYPALEEGPYKQVSWDVGQMLRSIFFTQGHAAAFNAMMRWEYGMEALTAVHGLLIMRILKNSEVYVMVDFPAYMYYKADLAKMAEVKTPVKVLFSTGTPPWRHAMANWLGAKLNAPVAPSLSEHAPYFAHPVETADVLRTYFGEAGAG